MLCPVVCFSCGCPIGDVADLFRHIRAKRVAAVLGEHKTLPTQAAVDPGLRIELTADLARLGVTNDCCVGHLITACEFGDYY